MNMLKLYLGLLGLLMLTNSLAQDTLPSSSDTSYIPYKELINNPYKDPEASLASLAYYRNRFIEEKDTAKLIRCYVAMSGIHNTKGMLSQSYDFLWDALLLADDFNNYRLLMEIHQKLSILYKMYSKDQESIDHLLKAKAYTAKLIEESAADSTEFRRIYFALAIRYRQQQDFDKALAYLDTCMYFAEIGNLSDDNKAFYLSEMAYCQFRKGNNALSDSLMDVAISTFETNENPYLVVAYSQKGSILLERKDYKKSLRFYRKALKAMETYNKHANSKPSILKNMAKCHAALGEYRMAYNNSLKSNALNERIYGSRSVNNKELFEIRNRYKETINEQEARLAKQFEQLKEKRQANFRLTVLLIVTALTLTLTLVVSRMRAQQKKYAAEKQKHDLEAKLEHEKHEAILEVKNKELTSYTLQLIDKEREIDKLKLKIKESLPKGESIKILASSVGNSQLWNDFNKRFTQVNSGFYDSLREKYPTLTPTEVKHCALIKLNFSGKEMAQLLNISLNSVHISRHRLRKKMELQRDVNLSSHIATI